MATSTTPVQKTLSERDIIKLPQLTFTRFIAAIAIVIFHFKDEVYPFKLESVKNFVEYFSVLVSYFFVLSGFILTINAKDRIKLKPFYVNRFARIYPLYIVALFLMLFLLLMARTPKDTLSFDKIILSVFLVQTWFEKYALSYNFPAWSLSVEAFFYLVFPGVIFVLRNKTLKQQIVSIVVFWLLMQIVFVHMMTTGKTFVLNNPIFHVSTFLLGIAAGKLFKAQQEFLKKNINILELLSVALFLVLIYLITTRNAVFNQYFHNGTLAPAFIIFIYTVALSRRRLIQLFADRRLEYLGEISYGIYILQFPVSILIFGIINRIVYVSPTIAFYIYLPSLIIISAITYHVVEKPCRERLKYLFTKKEAV